MEKLLATYLFQHKICPLPTIGSLVLRVGNAQTISGEKRMLAPFPFIELNEKEVSAFALTDFIAKQQNISTAKAENLLAHYCDTIKQLPPLAESELATAGSFYVDETAQLHFKSSSMPEAYFPEVVAERVIHLDASHEMLVGDTQTNTVAMSELLNEEAPVKNRWWITALLLAVIGFALIFYYYSHHPLGAFGNVSEIPSPIQINNGASETNR